MLVCIITALLRLSQGRRNRPALKRKRFSVIVCILRDSLIYLSTALQFHVSTASEQSTEDSDECQHDENTDGTGKNVYIPHLSPQIYKFRKGAYFFREGHCVFPPARSSSAMRARSRVFSSTSV